MHLLWASRSYAQIRMQVWRRAQFSPKFCWIKNRSNYEVKTRVCLYSSGDKVYIQSVSLPERGNIWAINLQVTSTGSVCCQGWLTQLAYGPDWSCTGVGSVDCEQLNVQSQHNNIYKKLAWGLWGVILCTTLQPHTRCTCPNRTLTHDTD